MKPHDDFQVVWLPGADQAAVAHRAKCEVASLGVARSGRRFGIRVHVADFPRVFQETKPDAVYLAPGSRVQFTCGPWPFGSDRKSIARMLKAHGWEARPLQPSQNVPGGMMWTIQAVVDPPTNVLPLQHGQVVISRCDVKDVPSQPSSAVVGQAKTVELCSTANASDPWLVQDPWSKGSAPVSSPAVAPVVLQDVEQRIAEQIEQKLLARLPATERMEVDDQDQRLQLLESQIQQLSDRQTGLETTVNEHHQQNTVQVQSLQHQMKMQMDLQTQQMQSMLSDQMARIETILSKKPRHE